MEITANNFGVRVNQIKHPKVPKLLPQMSLTEDKESLKEDEPHSYVQCSAKLVFKLKRWSSDQLDYDYSNYTNYF